MQYKKYKQYRLPGYDYSERGDYFITICTKNRIHHFGKITKTNVDPFIELTPIGLCVKDSILSIPESYKEALLGETVVMPDHIHLVISLLNTELKSIPEPSTAQQIISPQKGLKPLTPGSVSSIINHLKGKVTKWCNANEYGGFQWQSRFHDHIIRNIEEYNRISNYIANNIWNWKGGENNEQGDNLRKDIRFR